MLRSTQSFSQAHEDLKDHSEAKSVGGFLEQLTELGDVLELYGAQQEAELGVDLTAQIEHLKQEGWVVYAGERDKYYKYESKTAKLRELAIAVVRSDCESVHVYKDKFLVKRPDSKAQL